MRDDLAAAAIAGLAFSVEAATSKKRQSVLANKEAMEREGRGGFVNSP